MTDALVLRDNARNQLLEIRTIESGLEYLNKMKAIEVWAKAEKKDAELQNIIAEQKLRTQRILGQLIKDSDISSGNKSTLKQFADSTQQEPSERLADYGLNKKQSSTFQQIASIPDETFEEFIYEKKQAVNDAVAELTTTGAVRLARSLKDKEDSIDIMQDVEEDLRTQKEIKELAKHINITYTKEHRKLIISLIKI